MKTNQEQIIEALSGLIPEDAQEKVTAVVTTFVENAVSELEEEYNSKLNEGFKQAHEERLADQKIAEEGYSQALEIITSLRDRIEIQKEEFNQALEEGFEEAYQMLQEERGKKDMLEMDLYEEYDKRLLDIKEYMIDKLEEFLQIQDEKYHEMARRDALNDPAIAEHSIAFEQILEVASKYLSDEDYAFATNSRLEQLQRGMEDTKAQMKILEAKNVRLATENNKLNEVVRQSHELINENTSKSEKKARAERARKAEGRGQATVNPKDQVVLSEYDSGETVAEHKSNDRDSENLVEQIGENVERVVSDWKHLSGLIKEAE